LSTFANNGLQLHYEVHGKGRPVVLLHGGTVSFEQNFALHGWIERLNKEGLQVIGLDFRGHGKSDKPHDTAAYGTARLAGDVVALLDHLKLARVSLVGYSIGTAVALHLLHTLPKRFDKAALIATGDGLAGFPPHTLDAVTPWLALVIARRDYPKDLPRHLATYWNFVERSGGDRDALRAFASAKYPSLSTDQAAQITAPVLVVSGALDLVLGRGRRLAATLAQGRYLEIAGADHFSLATDAEVQDAVASFIAGK